MAARMQSERPRSARSVDPSVRSIDLWKVLSSSEDKTEFMQAWLTLTCTAVPDIAQGVVFTVEAPENAMRPAALWSRPGDAPSAEFGDAARRLLGTPQNARDGLVERTAEGDFHAAYSFWLEGEPAGGVVVATGRLSQDDARRVLRHLHWSQAWVEAFLRRQADADQAGIAVRARSLLDMVALVAPRSDFIDAARVFAGALQTDLELDRVAIGLARRGRVRVEALSQTANFERSMDLVRALASAMEEAVDQHEALLFCRSEHAGKVDAKALGRLADLGGAHSVLTVPMPFASKVVGAVTLERTTAEPFSQRDIDLADALVATLTPILMDKKERSRGLVSLIGSRLASGLGMLFGPRALGWKLAGLLLAAAIAASMLIKTELRIAADTAVQGEIRRIVSAPFDGYVAAAHVRAGEIVSEGALLAELDESELRLDQLRITAQRRQNLLELDRATGERSLAEIAIFRARVAQDEAELALVDDQIARTQISAPFAGVVVSGDLSQTVGQPVSRGDALFELAPLDNYRLVALVSEADIHLIEAGAEGRLLLAALPDQAYAFSVDSISPIASAGDGVNGFEVIGTLNDPTGRVRPGMEGVARIDAGERSYAAIWTRTLVAWVRLQIWSWWP